MSAKTKVLACFTCFYVIVIIVGIILFSLSFSVVDINKVALKKNTLSVQVEPGVIYLSGRYFIGITGKFIVYDTVWSSVEFSKDPGSDSTTIRAKTAQASEAELDITFMYKIRPEFLHLLFAKYPAQNHHLDLVNTAKERIQSVVTRYSIDDFFNKRVEITNAMAFAVAAAVRASFYCEVTVFLLRELSLQSRYEDNILTGLISLRQAETANQKKLIGEYEGQISVLDSQAKILIDQAAANASITASNIRATQEALGEALIQKALSDGLTPFKTELQFPSEHLNLFLYYDKLRNFNLSTVYAGFGTGAVFSV